MPIQTPRRMSTMSGYGARRVHNYTLAYALWMNDAKGQCGRFPGALLPEPPKFDHKVIRLKFISKPLRCCRAPHRPNIQYNIWLYYVCLLCFCFVCRTQWITLAYGQQIYPEVLEVRVHQHKSNFAPLRPLLAKMSSTFLLLLYGDGTQLNAQIYGSENK